ncbi:hypothetical protein BLNAU_5227 [Blattamonas nauphoetae]|uniref:Right handed beta helix domain-containing protein n=1 Tax=Blattamonas nauphoetae TaxID=2049346 RepID=A0ABQ9Y7S2_9EUKA|nr:hypothetical protein BLNAU_5227 [Blattamonas nauphoetae]
MEGQYIGNKIDIFDESIELSGSSSTSSRTTIEIGADKIASHEDDTLRNSNVETCENYLFSLRNSSLSIKSIEFSLINNFDESRRSRLNNDATRLAIVTHSMLTIADSVLAVPSISSPILDSSANSHSSTMQTSVLLEKCSISNEVGEVRGFVETSAFPSFGGSVSVSIVGCSFDSATILGNDGVGLSLTRTADQSGEDIGTISSSLIDCSFVNVSSMGSSCQTHLPHLSQKMLGCVVSLTSSHLSGSTIRDVNTGGSVLCSNSSFSSLLSPPNTNPTQGTVTLPGESIPEPFVSDKTYSFDKDSGSQTTSVTFSHCLFTGDNHPSARPLTFSEYPGTISIDSCSFDNIAFTGDLGGAISIVVTDQFDHLCFKVELSNFTSCSAGWTGGAMSISVADGILVRSCLFDSCSTNDPFMADGGAGLNLFGSESVARIPKFELTDCILTDCTAVIHGGGVQVSGSLDLSVVDTKFERCEVSSQFITTYGGGICVVENCQATLSVEQSHFIECSSVHAGGAICHLSRSAISVSDTLVKNCSSGSTGVICVIPSGDPAHLSFSKVLFDGNLVGSDTSFLMWVLGFGGSAPKFPDIAIMCESVDLLPTFEFADCFTTIVPDSTGLIYKGTELISYQG